jgi:hypothetical protein
LKRAIITHVGISALSCEALRLTAPFDIDRLRDDLLAETARLEQLKLCAEALSNGLSDTWGREGFRLTDRRYESPAEIAALSQIGVESDDAVVLVHSATTAGRFCADLLANVLENPAIRAIQGYPRCKDGQVRKREVEGLQISDDSARDPRSTADGKASFVGLGVASYIRHVWEAYVELKPGDQLIFNITGGYKGLVPVARDVAALLVAHGDSQNPPVSVRMGYLFQTSSEIIWHDPLPFTFMWDRLPLDALRQAGATEGLAVQDVPSSWAILFEPADRLRPEVAARKRSAAGEVVYALEPYLGGRSANGTAERST